MSREKEQILVVDDIEFNRQMIMDVLEENYDIWEAENGLQAWNFLNNSQNHFSAVIMDYNMPVMDGLEALAKIYNVGMTKWLPVFIVTGDQDTELLESAYDLGAADVIFKPYSAAVFKRRFAKIKELYDQSNELQRVANEQKSTVGLMGVNSEMLQKSSCGACLK